MARKFSSEISLQRRPSILDELPGHMSPTNRLMSEVQDPSPARPRPRAQASAN